jgi:hypothetical protein
MLKSETFEDAPEELECPYELLHVWQFFRDLDARRANGGMGGFSPITHSEITAWSEGMDIGISPFERRCIVAIDDAYRVFCSKRKDKDE